MWGRLRVDTWVKTASSSHRSVSRLSILLWLHSSSTSRKRLPSQRITPESFRDVAQQPRGSPRRNSTILPQSRKLCPVSSLSSNTISSPTFSFERPIWPDVQRLRRTAAPCTERHTSRSKSATHVEHVSWPAHGRRLRAFAWKLCTTLRTSRHLSPPSAPRKLPAADRPSRKLCTISRSSD